MDFELSEEQRILKEMCKRFVDREILPYADEWDKRYHPFPKSLCHELIKKCIPLGYVGTVIPREYGGQGQTFLTAGLMSEEIRRGCASLGGVLGITGSAARLIAEAGSEDQRARYLSDLLEGNLIGCVAITEPNVGSDAANVQTMARCVGDDWVINGTKTWISNGTVADVVIVVAQTDPSKGYEGIARFLVDRRTSSFQARDIPKMGLRSFPTAELVFEDCKVPAENMLGELGTGFRFLMKGFEVARCNAALASVGVAQAAIDIAIRYAQERWQFGSPIGGFQMVQAMVADMVTECEAARLLGYWALSRLDKGLRCARESSMAKAYATEMGVRVTSMALQIHGAYGLSEEYPLERLFRDARCYTIPDGTTQIQKLIIGREVLGIKAFRQDSERKRVRP